MRHLVVVVALAGCVFEPPFPDDDPPEEPAPAPAPDTAMTPCSVTGTRLCVEFDHADLWTRDATGLAVTASNVTREASDLGYAVRLGAASELVVAESDALDIADEITFEMWIYGDATVYGNRAYLLDNNSQYSLSITDATLIRCGVEDFAVDSGMSIAGGWHHVACTYDKSRLRVYVDGELRGCKSESKSIPTDGNDGTAIGANLSDTSLSERFEGRIDNVHVYDRRLAGSELCTLAGNTDCNDQCPGGGGGGGD